MEYGKNFTFYFQEIPEMTPQIYEIHEKKFEKFLSKSARHG